MDLEKAKTDIAGIVDALQGLPSEYRAKGFELLLQHALSEQKAAPSEPGTVTAGSRIAIASVAPSDQPALSKEFRSFLTRTGLSESDVFTLIDVEDGEAELRQQPVARGKAQGQIQIALLLALRAGVVGRPLEVDAAQVREACKSSPYYDEANFSANFKKSAALFNGSMKSGDPPRRLSLEGERQLAQLVRSLVREFTPRT